MKRFYHSLVSYRYGEAILLSGILLIYAALTLGNITRWSIWFDEAFGAYLTRFNFIEIAQLTAQDVHPPFYYWVLKVWSSLFGATDLGFRSLSLVMGMVAIVIVFVLIKRLFTSTTWALVGAFLMSISPLMVRLGDEARMYTMVCAIVFGASYALIRASEARSSRWWWVLYGALVCIGMLTHYFTALAWLAHWVWRWREKRAGRLKRFWSREWILSYGAAILLFSWWLPVMVYQFTSVQKGFWIPGVSVYSIADYLTNIVLYRQYGEAAEWWAVLAVCAVIVSVMAIRRGYPVVKNRSPIGANLLVSLAAVPPILLMIISLPPLKSAMIDRYILYSQVALVVLVGVCFAAALSVRPISRRLRLAVIGLSVIMLVGVGNVYYFGNYNKNSSTSIRVKEVVQQINHYSSAEYPIISETPWIYYEAVVYNTQQNGVYFLESSTNNYKEGALAALKASDFHKIKDLEAFTKQHRYVWYIGNKQSGDMLPPVVSWKAVTSVEGYDYIENNARYRATLFDTAPNAE